MDKVKNALHLNKDNSTTSTHHTTTGATTHNNGVPEGTAGPHTSRIGNAADPRVDSDLDSTRHTGHTGTVGTGAVGTGSSGYTGTGTGTGVTGSSGVTTTAGPHSSSLANKVDPRVDSDLDGSRNFGAATGNTGASAYGSNTTGTGYTGSNTHTTHGTTGTTGGLSNSTNAGPHNSNLANKVDPRVDSDLDGRGNRHGAATGGLIGTSGSHATPGSGTAQNTAGPHNSDLANKLDPRVDADLDGSKTFGGNKTHA